MTTPTQPDLFTGEKLKDAGTERVLEHNSEWHEHVMRLIQALADSEREFTADDLRELAAHSHVGEPSHPNAWGAAINAASREKRIRCVGYRKSEAPAAHARVVAVWRGTGLPF